MNNKGNLNELELPMDADLAGMTEEELAAVHEGIRQVAAEVIQRLGRNVPSTHDRNRSL